MLPSLGEMPDEPLWYDWRDTSSYFRVVPRGGDPLWFNPNTSTDPADPLGGGRFQVNRATEFMERTRSEALPPRSAYNIVGQVLEGIGAYDFGQYARRVSDVEGVRRAALAAVTLHAANVDPTNVAAALAASPLRDPYTDRPFEWKENDGAIVFRGLGLSERAEHRIRY